MAKFDEIKPGSRVSGLMGNHVAEIVSVSKFGPDAINLVFRANNSVHERLLYRGDEHTLSLEATGQTYAFDADGALLRLASEAYRIRLAHLFDPYLAISASQIEALPHQITAVYGEMLPRQPLRFLLADDPGAGKTVMAGLLIKELLIRGDVERCLIVAPGSLVEQWQEEMAEKFGLGFDLLTRDQIEASLTGNPFVEKSRLIVRLDMASRSDELKAKLEAAPDWDLIICDEAHRMAASYFGGEVKETQRHKLGKLLGTKTRNFLLMSATPHNGKEADFQLFMGLLDADRFEGRFREGVHKADVTDMMRRLRILPDERRADCFNLHIGLATAARRIDAFLNLAQRLDRFFAGFDKADNRIAAETVATLLRAVAVSQRERPQPALEDAHGQTRTMHVMDVIDPLARFQGLYRLVG